MTVDKLRTELEPLLRRLRGPVPHLPNADFLDGTKIWQERVEAAEAIQSLLLRIAELEARNG